MNNFICKACSNGCNISFDMHAENEASISGYQCNKGSGYAEKHLSREFKMNIVINNKDKILASDYSLETLSQITGFWNIKFKTIHPQVGIVGSPERTNFRIIIEDDGGEFLILEKIFNRTLETKLTILKTLDFLHKKGLKSIQPYLKNMNNEYITKHEDSHWQLTPFIKGKALDRLNYVFDGWRGRASAEFLIDLHRTSENIPFFNKSEVFLLPHYIHKLIDTIKKHNPKVVDRITPVLEFLEAEFLTIYDKLPVSFCHGDYHPLNIIWTNNDIRAVIDWEFSGYKPEIYDIANLLGCLGIENPQSLQGEFVAEFISGLRSSRIISDLSWDFLLEFIVALRFAWLSEWLRKKDYEMVDLEETYMKLLIENKAVLKEIWEDMRTEVAVK